MELKSASNHNILAFSVPELSFFSTDQPSRKKSPKRVAVVGVCRNCLRRCVKCEFWEGL